MFIKTLEVENFKGYHGKHTIDFNIPDMNNDGSGLNIFVGENNSGKSTIFEALDFIKDSTKKEPNSLVNKSNPTLNLTSFSVEVSYTGNVTGCVNAHIQANKVRSFTNFIHLKGNNEHFKVKRSWDANTPDEIKKINFWDNANSVYTNTSGIDAPL
ncbi:AAA family ATPase [Enterobacter bugandensis]|uniref:AAA family ATPase n=1 Tax=Enterobacter bugandensis TaxID=881260 RepID=UPI00200332F7|nr:AAA family ATPase [Enterobacter bugandensis]MCK6876705.1 AAA family ATPase [Enterobacter bugandensis]